jgi:hypothetical protein
VHVYISATGTRSGRFAVGSGSASAGIQPVASVVVGGT